MTIMNKNRIEPANGRLGILCVGLGAVSSTLITGVLMARKGLAKPIGSITQMARIRVSEEDGTEAYKTMSEIVPMAKLDDIVFGAWEIFPDNAYESAMHAEVLKEKDIRPVKDELEAIVPMPGVFDVNYVKRLNGTFIKPEMSRMAQANALRQDIRDFKERNNLDRIVVVWAASTEIYVERNDSVHGSLETLEEAMRNDDRTNISPSMCYAYAALMEGAPFVMGAPNTCVDIPAMWQLAEKQNMPITGKDFKTGQTFMKTVLAPAFRTRCLGVSGWFSTNILGNRDGEVLDCPENFRTKEVSKLSVIETILKAEEYPDLYSDIFHKVRINYYPPRGDDKEGWDNIDIFGWMGYPMQIKVDFLCKDSILAAPIMLDLALCTDLAQRAGMSGIQSWLSFFLKTPMHKDDEEPLHDVFQQYTVLKNMVRSLGGYPANEHID